MGYGIDIGSSSLKVVALRRTLKGFRVVGAGRCPTPKIERPEEYRPAVARLLYEAMGGGGGRRVAVIGLGGRDVNLQVVNQPRTTPVNYRTLMRYEVDQRREAGGVYADWCTLREPDEYFPQYLAMVGVGRSAYVDERIAAVTAARVEVRDAIPNALALFAVYRNSYDVEGGTQLLLDVGADNLDMALVRGGRVIFARNVSTGARVFDSSIAAASGLSPQEAESLKIQFGNLAAQEDGDRLTEQVHPAMRSAAGQLAGIIQSSITFAKAQLQDKELTVDKTYLSGAGARVRGLQEYLSSALKMPVEILDPFRKLDARSMEAVEDFRRLPTDMTVAIGLAMIASTPADGAARLSIMPDSILRRRNFFQRTAYLIAAGAVAALAMLAISAAAMARRTEARQAYEEFTRSTAAVNQRIEDLNRIEAEQRDATSKARMLQAQTIAGRGAVDAVSKLRKILPEGVNLGKLEFVDLSERPRNPVPKKRVVFHWAGRGMVTGAVVREEQGTFTLASGEEFAASEAGEVRSWTAPSRGVQIEGEIDENIRGGAAATLDTIKEQLTDPSRGISVEIPYQEASRDKPGWRAFRIVVRFE